MAYRRGSVDRSVHAARDLSDQVRRGRNRRGVTIGPWSLDVDRNTGALTATHRPTGTVRVLAELEEPAPLEFPGPVALGASSTLPAPQPPPPEPPLPGVPIMCLLDHQCGPDCPPAPA